MADNGRTAAATGEGGIGHGVSAAAPSLPTVLIPLPTPLVGTTEPKVVALAEWGKGEILRANACRRWYNGSGSR